MSSKYGRTDETQRLVSEPAHELPRLSSGRIGKAPRTPEYRRALYNVLVLSLAFCFVFSAYFPTQGFMGKLNKRLGYWTLTVLYASIAILQGFAPWLLNIIGLRRSLFIGSLFYCLFVGVNIMEPIYASIIPCAFAIAAGAALLWSAQGAYLIANTSAEDRGFFSGLFYAIFMSSAVWGNLIAKFLLPKDDAIAVARSLFSLGGGGHFFTGPSASASESATEGNLMLLSVDADAAVGLAETKYPTVLFTVLCIVSAVGSCTFLLLRAPAYEKKQSDPQNPQQQHNQGDVEADPSSSVNGDRAQKSDLSPWKLLASMFLLFAERNFLVLFPIFLYSGLSMGIFNGGVFLTLLDEKDIPIAVLIWGAGEVVGSLILGRVSDVKWIGHYRMLIITLVLESGVVVLSWMSYKYGGLALFFSTFAILGIADGALNCMCYAIIGFMYPNREAPAVSGYKLCQSLGYAIIFFITQFVNVTEILWTVTAYNAFCVILSLVFMGPLTRAIRENFQPLQSDPDRQ